MKLRLVLIHRGSFAKFLLAPKLIPALELPAKVGGESHPKIGPDGKLGGWRSMKVLILLSIP